MSQDDHVPGWLPWQIYAAEMLGTGVLVFLGCGSVITDSVSNGATGIVGIAACFGLAVAMMAYAIGPISGCHINPALTIGLAATGHFPWKRVMPYICAQLAGAAAASLLHLSIFGSVVASKVSFGATIPTVSPTAALALEVATTFVLMFVVMSFATNEKAPAAMASVGIAAMIVAGIVVTGNVTGGSMNPARSFGPALFAGGAALATYWVYVAGPVIGAVLGAFCYDALREHAEAARPIAVVTDHTPTATPTPL
jgi:aquaporin NIP